MSVNSASIASKWVNFIASRPEFAAGDALLAQFENGKITSICQCGCNGFEFEPAGSDVPLLTPPSEKGCIAFQLEFFTENNEGSVQIMVYTNGNGSLAGIDVDYCSNAQPMPNEVFLIEPPYQVYGMLAVMPNKSLKDAP
jgi:hypothetical protein